MKNHHLTTVVNDPYIWFRSQHESLGTKTVMDYVTFEMLIHGATSIGGAVIYIGRNPSERTELWKLISVFFSGFMLGLTFTIPLQQMLSEVTLWGIGAKIGEGSRMGIALVLGFIAPVVFQILNNQMKKIKDDPSTLTRWLVNFIKKNLSKNEYVVT